MSQFDPLAERFFTDGWVAFESDPAIAAWARAACPLAEEAMADEALKARWTRSGGTWFVGVNALLNDATGAVPERGVPPLAGRPVAFAANALGLGGFEWDRAQLSITRPGYPQRDPDESDTAYRYRLKRDAAHVDGLLRDGAGGRRLGETHGFILGIPLSPAAADDAPFVVYEGSHEIMRRAFVERFAGIEPERWEDEDVTDAYVAARKRAFATCRRVEVHVEPGRAYMAHRLLLHGVAPWRTPAAQSDGNPLRMIAYFRPDVFPGQPKRWWLDRP